MEKRRIKERQSARVNTDTESSDEWSGGRDRNGDHGMVMRPTCKQAQGRRDWAGINMHQPTPHDDTALKQRLPKPAELHHVLQEGKRTFKAFFGMSFVVF